ncbi:MAG: ABC transporter permease [Bryobacteraceae bacterium]
MDHILQDVRFGLRQLRKSPVFTLAAILTLALGIGANATIFTWLSAVILNPVPGVDSRGLIAVHWQSPKGGARSVSWLDYLDYRKRNRTLESYSVSSVTSVNLGVGSQPERIWGMLASSNYFETLGVKPILGRTFLPEEDENPGGHPVVVIGHRLWQTKFGAEPNIVGRQIVLNQRNFTVIGVTPEPFVGSVLGLRFELWVPVTMVGAISGKAASLTNRGQMFLQGQARLRPGVDQRQAEADLTAISAQLRREFSQSDIYNRADAVPIWREGGGSVLGPLMMMLMGVVGVVLLIACANVANLLLARAAGRQREIAIRLALGVSRGRLIRQLLIENTLLAVGGLAASLIALPTTMRAIQGFTPPSDLPVALAIHLDAGVVLFTIAIALLSTLLFGLAPAIRASRTDVLGALKEESGGTSSPGRAWLRNSLVVAQVALSMVLLISAGLFLKSMSHAASANPGFDPRNVLVAGIDLRPNGYDEVRGVALLRQMIDTLSALPGVTSVSSVKNMPLGLGGTSSSSFAPEGYVPARNEEVVADTNVVGPDYFRTINTPILNGRDFSPADTAETQHVIVVNEALSRRYFPKGGALGRSVRVFGESWIVAGVVSDAKYEKLDEKPRPYIFVPFSQRYDAAANFLVRTSGDPVSYSRAVQDAIHSLDSALPVYGVRTMQTAISASFFGQMIGSSFLGLFGVVALAMAAIGLYGVLAYTVTLRSREVGIRMALGSSRGAILRMILGQGLKLAGIGLGIGLAIAFGVTRLMRSLLLDVSPTDVPTILGVAALLALVSLAASYFPAYRAARIDPILAIRHD